MVAFLFFSGEEERFNLLHIISRPRIRLNPSQLIYEDKKKKLKSNYIDVTEQFKREEKKLNN